MVDRAQLFSSSVYPKCFKAGEFSQEVRGGRVGETRVLATTTLLRLSFGRPDLSCRRLVGLAGVLAESYARSIRGVCHHVYFGMFTRGHSSRSGGFACVCGRGSSV